MGTRSLTRFKEGDRTVAALYGQYDGYVTGHGRQLANALRGHRMVNGFNGREGLAFNGVGCLAASVVAAFKDGIGGYYLQHPDTDDGEYTYELTVNRVKTQDDRFIYDLEPEIQVRVTAYRDVLFEGTHNEFVEWAFLEESDDEEDAEESR